MTQPPTATRFASLTVTIAFAVSGCGDLSDSTTDNHASLLEFRLTQAVLGFQNTEQSFGPSTTADELVRNAHWIDRMAVEYQEVEAVERELLAMGEPSLVELKADMAQRFRRHLATLKSDSQYVDAMHQLEILKIWSEI